MKLNPNMWRPNNYHRSGMARGSSHSGSHLAALSGYDGSGYVLITGGSGFIGSNLAHRLLSDGERVVVYDNLSRPGVEQNLEWLREEFGDRLIVIEGDTRDAETLARAVEHAGMVFHFAGQVAVTTSLETPSADFEVNASGTLKVLEAIRALPSPPPLLFTSTNKVYGPIDDIPLRLQERRYEPVDETIREQGVDEGQRLDFYSPYGCSKGAADQYVLDYARSYNLRALVFRMSCIYGPRQFGTEDQGWVAHFLIRALAEESLTLYGDGCQVRDVLFVDDLVEAFLAARQQMSELSGNAFNIGGGPSNTTSLLELIDLIEELEGHRPKIDWKDWRIGDQRFYVSNTSKFSRATGWYPRVGIHEGVRRLHSWLRQMRAKQALAAA